MAINWEKLFTAIMYGNAASPRNSPSLYTPASSQMLQQTKFMSQTERLTSAIALLNKTLYIQ